MYIATQMLNTTHPTLNILAAPSGSLISHKNDIELLEAILVLAVNFNVTSILKAYLIIGMLRLSEKLR